jgi:septal ring factor EnvC (AmiA/AmiB activator)
VIARTYREVQERSEAGPNPELVGELTELHQRRAQLQDSIRAVLSLGNQNAFMADELKRLNGELNSLERSIAKLDSQPVAASGPIELTNVTDALQRIDPIWEVLHPEEQRRVLKLLVETVTVSKENVEVRFRANGIEQVVEELEPMGAGSND